MKDCSTILQAIWDLKVKIEIYGPMSKHRKTHIILFLLGNLVETLLLEPQEFATKETLEWKNHKLIKRVIGGEISGPHEFPHMAAIGWKSASGEFNYHCGGSLISHYWVLTAAHCTHGRLRHPKIVRLGSNNLYDERGKEYGIELIRVHPQYKPPAKYYDIALLKLMKRVIFGDYIKPACLHSQYHTIPTEFWVTGWGVTEFDGEMSVDLMKAKIEPVNSIACSLLYNTSVFIPRGIIPSMFCAGDPYNKWERDTCDGDSGSPVQQKIVNSICLYEIIGVTSFGHSCGLPGFAGIYMRVSHFIYWIKSIAWPHA